MYTVNITFRVPHHLLDEWRSWMHDEWQPKVSQISPGSAFRLHRLLRHDDEHGTTIVFQLFLASRALLNSYLESKEAPLHQLMTDKWGENILFFQTILEQWDQ